MTAVLPDVPAKTPEAEPEYVLRLFVAGLTPRSLRAIDSVRRLCERYLPGHHRMEVVDVYQCPDLAREQQIVATPTLLRLLPTPVRRLMGDLSEEDRVLRGLGIKCV